MYLLYHAIPLLVKRFFILFESSVITYSAWLYGLFISSFLTKYWLEIILLCKYLIEFLIHIEIFSTKSISLKYSR